MIVCCPGFPSLFCMINLPIIGNAYLEVRCRKQYRKLDVVNNTGSYLCVHQKKMQLLVVRAWPFRDDVT